MTRQNKCAKCNGRIMYVRSEKGETHFCRDCGHEVTHVAYLV